MKTVKVSFPCGGKKICKTAVFFDNMELSKDKRNNSVIVEDWEEENYWCVLFCEKDDTTVYEVRFRLYKDDCFSLVRTLEPICFVKWIGEHFDEDGLEIDVKITG